MQQKQKQKPKRLGRGLSSLISVESPVVGKPAAADELVPASGPAGVIKVTEIQPNPFQPRKVMAAEELQALADSIKASGLIQPVIVRASGDNAYHLIAGERRWRASQMAGLSEIPAVVRDATDEEMLEIALAENIFREDLNAIDRATAYRRYCDEFSLSAEQVAQRLGEDRTTVTNYLRLLDLPEEVKQWVADGKLAMGHARCLLAIPSPSDLIRTAKQAMNLGLSVRSLEKLVRDRVNARKSASQPSVEIKDGKRPQIRSLEETFVRALGTKVEINESRRKGSGKIVIHYHNLDDFDRVAERLNIDA